MYLSGLLKLLSKTTRMNIKIKITNEKRNMCMKLIDLIHSNNLINQSNLISETPLLIAIIKNNVNIQSQLKPKIEQ